MKNLCEALSKLFMIEEIIKHTLLVLVYGFANTFIRLIAIPIIFLIKAFQGIAKYSDEQGTYHCEQLSDIYKSLLKEQQDEQ